MKEQVRELTANETAAMWHFHDRYAAQSKGAIEFYRSLSQRERDFIADMVAEILKAAKRK
jgi:hypothetical protein